MLSNHQNKDEGSQIKKYYKKTMKQQFLSIIIIMAEIIYMIEMILANQANEVSLPTLNLLKKSKFLIL